MARILKIAPIRSGASEPDAEPFEPQRWLAIERPASQILLDTQNLREAQDFTVLLRSHIEKIPEITRLDVVAIAPVKSFAHGDRYIIRVNGTDNFGPMLEAYLSREANPPHTASKRSFAELLDVSFKAGHSLGVFTDTLLHEWGNGNERMTPQAFSEWMKKRNSRRRNAGTITDPVIYSWLRGMEDFRPSGRSVSNMSSAFIPTHSPLYVRGSTPALEHRHALKLYRMISGQPIDPERTQKLMNAVKRRQEHGTLFTTLIEQSGVDPEVLSRWAGFNVREARYGHHIRDQECAERLINLVNPPSLNPWEPENPDIVTQNARLAEILTGRPLSLSFEDMAARARKSDEPPRTLFNLLVGPSGKVKMNDEQLAVELGKYVGTPYTWIQVNFRRRGMKAVIEKEALAIAEIAGCTKEQTESCVEVLTGCKSATVLLDKVAHGRSDVSIQDMFRMMRLRKGKSQHGLSLPQSTISKFEAHPENPPPESRTANKMADDIDLTGKDRRRFVLLVMRRPVMEANQIIGLIVRASANSSLRRKTLQTLFDQTGIARALLAEAMGTYRGMLGSWVQKGVIPHPEIPVAEVLTKHLFIPDGRKMEFMDTFNQTFVHRVAPATRSNPRAKAALALG